MSKIKNQIPVNEVAMVKSQINEKPIKSNYKKLKTIHIENATNLTINL